jgi:hypothetical protein
MRSVFYLLLLWCCIEASVAPIFNCWFITYNDQDPANVTSNYNIVYGYNNSEGMDMIIAVDNSNNVITPTAYNGNQPYVFKQGVYQLMYTLKDSSDTLKEVNGAITWKIGNEITVVNHDDIINDAFKCKTQSNNVCPLWIDNYCEDSLYCNGKEICYSAGFIGIGDPYTQYGTCKQSAYIVQCTNQSQQCSESDMKCVSPTTSPTDATNEPTITPSTSPSDAPTDTPTDATNEPTITPSTSPSDAPTDTTNEPTITPSTSPSEVVVVMIPTIAPTDATNEPSTSPSGTEVVLEIPTDAPTISPSDEEVVVIDIPTDAPVMDIPSSLQCTTDVECESNATFCKGPSKCDTELNVCVQVDSNYNACQLQQDRLDQYFIVSNTTNDDSLSIICVEHALLCIETFACNTDSDCDDGNICNGIETCGVGSMSNMCSTAGDQSIITICGSDKMTCKVDEGCVLIQTAPTNSSSSDSAILVIIILVCVGVGVILLMLVLFSLYYGTAASNSRKKSKPKRS